MEFIDNSAVGGIRAEMSAGFLDRFYKSKSEAELKKVQVQCMPIAALLDLVGVRKVDVFFLDVEGAELAVLNGVDFSHLNIKYMVIEMDGGNPEKDKGVHELLKKNGYEFVMKIGQKYNDLFRKKE